MKVEVDEHRSFGSQVVCPPGLLDMGSDEPSKRRLRRPAGARSTESSKEGAMHFSVVNKLFGLDSKHLATMHLDSPHQHRSHDCCENLVGYHSC